MGVKAKAQVQRWAAVVVHQSFASCRQIWIYMPHIPWDVCDEKGNYTMSQKFQSSLCNHDAQPCTDFKWKLGFSERFFDGFEGDTRRWCTVVTYCLIFQWFLFYTTGLNEIMQLFYLLSVLSRQMTHLQQQCVWNWASEKCVIPENQYITMWYRWIVWEEACKIIG